MISIKKYLDDRTRSKLSEGKGAPFSAVIDVFRAALVAIAKATALNGSPHGVELGSRLIGLDQRIGTKPSVEILQQAAIELEANLAVWSKRAEAEGSAKDHEIKELVLALANTAETVVARDQKNASQLGTLTGDLEKIGSLDDIRQIRNSIVQRVAEFRSSIEQMNQDSRELVSELRTRVTAVETRLKSVEGLALTDALTGIANRRCLEDRMAYNIEHYLPFCVVIFDLNRFKFINDTFGHLAGDDLLRQFAAKLKQKSRATDLIGRWGGDEFLLILPGSLEMVGPQVQRLQNEVCARYMIHGNNGLYSTMDTDAAVGVAQWQVEDSIGEVVSRADADMYRHKARMKEESQIPA